MERALAPEWLRLALGDHVSLPSAEEVSQLLAEAEVGLLLRKPQISEDLIAIGWYLHAIASSKYALRTYGFQRQRAAFQVAGHVFDLLLQTRQLSQGEKLKYCFAAQIAYLRSTLDPNAMALYQREFVGGLDGLGLLSGFPVALSCGVAFLGFDVRFVFQFTESLRSEIEGLEKSWNIEGIFSTPFASVAGVAFGTRDMMSFLVYGKAELLERARERLRKAVLSENSTEDHVSRWVAAHLLSLADDLNKASIWTALPPDVSPGVRKAFAMGHPRILTLWPPQLDMFSAGEQKESNPLSAQVKRLFLSTPTSSGKTLLAQLLVISHLSTEQTSVCYVAPTRSLCWEIRRSLESRMRFLGKEIVAGLPEGDWLDSVFTDFGPDVEVMTPERLSYLIRTDSNRLLERFGMFIFDEVHLVGEAARGWTLEEDLTYLHYATQGKEHRIVLMSAAVGNRNHFVEWMTQGEDKPFYRHSPWRGPRRLHAVWRTHADWQKSVTQGTRSKKYPSRVRCPQYGELEVRISHTGETRLFTTTEPIGELVLRIGPDGKREPDSTLSTPFYRMLVPIIRHLSESGPVLIVAATRPATILMAKAIADGLAPIEKPEIRSLADLVEARLGPSHPLCQVLRKGVAYHHGSLPGEIRTSVEEAVSEGCLRFLVATTTLTEGVNLPVRSVVVASQGSYGAGGYVEYITGSKLISAIGRAGRATKETEGIVVLARQAAPDPADFKRLDPDDSDIRITSMLATEKALNALATFEELQRTSEDAVFRTATGEVSDFLAFVWFVAAELQKTGGLPTQERVREVLGHSLAWVQLKPQDRDRWLAAAGATLALYRRTEASVRRRWAVAGTPMSSAAEMESIAQEVAAILRNLQVPQDPAEAVDLIIGGGRLQRILQLPEAPTRRAYTQRCGPSREEIAIPMESLLRDWLQGSDLVTLAKTYFNSATDMEFRFEQLGDFIYDYFEVFFPWVFGTIVGWTNTFLEELGAANLLPKTIPANIRWGVSNSTALGLMVRGIHSRPLALRVARAWQSEEREGVIHSWIRSMSMSDWQRTFQASPAELRSILEFSRDRRGGVAVDLIAQGIAEFEVASNFTEFAPNEAFLVPADDSDLPYIDIRVGEEVVGRILSRDQAGIRDLLITGLILSIKFSASSGRGLLSVQLVEAEA